MWAVSGVLYHKYISQCLLHIVTVVLSNRCIFHFINLNCAVIAVSQHTLHAVIAKLAGIQIAAVAFAAIDTFTVIEYALIGINTEKHREITPCKIVKHTCLPNKCLHAIIYGIDVSKRRCTLCLKDALTAKRNSAS